MSDELLHFHVLTNDRGQAMLVANHPVPRPKGRIAAWPDPADPTSWLVCADGKPWGSIPAQSAPDIISCAQTLLGWVNPGAKGLGGGKPIELEMFPGGPPA